MTTGRPKWGRESYASPLSRPLSVVPLYYNCKLTGGFATRYDFAWDSALGFERQSEDADDSIEFTFRGHTIGLVYHQHPSQGIANVDIDGTEYPDIDLYGADKKLDVISMIADDLELGEHVLTITNSGEKNPEADTAYLWILGFVVERDSYPIQQVVVGQVLGAIRGYEYDDDTHYMIAVDTDGHLQLDVLESSLSTDLGLIKGHVDNLEAYVDNVEGYIDALEGHVQGITDDSIKGLLRSIGDAGATPTNVAGDTVLSLTASTIDRLGAKVVSPDQYSVNARLKLIESYLDGLEGHVDGIEGYIDDLEARIGDNVVSPAQYSVNARLKLIESYLDGVEGHIDNLEGYVDNVEGYMDGLEAYVQGITDDSIKGLLRSIGDAGATPSDTTGSTVLLRLWQLTDRIGAKTASPEQYSVAARLKLLESYLDQVEGYVDDIETRIARLEPLAKGITSGWTDRSTHATGSTINGADQDVLSFTPDSGHTVYVWAFTVLSDAAGNISGTIKWDGTIKWVIRLDSVAFSKHIVFNPPLKFVGDGSKAFLFTSENRSGATHYVGGSIQCWEEPD